LIPVRAPVRIDALRARLLGRFAELDRPLTSDVMRVFLEVSGSASEDGLWSLAFAIDDDDGRIARLEARFWLDPDAPPDAELPGYEVRLTLPRILPVCTPAARKAAAQRVQEVSGPDDGLVARFVRALADLGEYRAVEPVTVLVIDVDLL